MSVVNEPICERSGMLEEQIGGIGKACTETNCARETIATMLQIKNFMIISVTIIWTRKFVTWAVLCV